MRGAHPAWLTWRWALFTIAARLERGDNVIQYRGLALGRRIRPRQAARQRAGFTLIEVLAALVILSTATYILVSMFQASRAMARENQLRTIASSMAREHLVYVTQQPEQLDWPVLRPGVLQPVPPKESAPQDTLTNPRPSIMPAVRQADRVQRNLYGALQTSTYVLLPAANKTFVEVVAVTEYVHQGRTYTVTLTSALPRAVVEPGGGPRE